MNSEVAPLACPLCSHTGVFHSAESLRDRLISVSTNNLSCPVCQEEICGLDKLTIHLFSHVKILTEGKSRTGEKEVTDKKCKLTREICSEIQQTKQRSAAAAKNKPSTSSIVSAPVKYVKIYPKLPVISLNPVPVIDISQRSSSEENVERVNEQIVVKSEAQMLQNKTTCNICGLQFVDENILKMHRCLIHNINETSPDSFSRHNCHLCPKHFKMRGSLMVHLRVAHYGFTSEDSQIENDFKDKPDGNANHPNQTQDKATNERNDNKQWQCDVCKKYFTTKYFLKKHKRLHTGETPYACLQCNKTFTFQQSYHKHLLYHNDEKPHSCNYCGRAFKELSTLHNHQRIHTGEKPFACETCGKCFRQRVSYLVHRRIHTGVMPYKCTACEKSFRYKVSQRTHKCQEQPPGTVVRKMGDLVEKLKKKHYDHKNPNSKNEMEEHHGQYIEISEANAELARTGAKLSLEDMETDSFQIFSENFCSGTDTSTMNASNSIFSTIVQSENASSNNKFDQNDQIFLTSIEDLIKTSPAEEKNLPSPSDIFRNLCLSKNDDSRSHEGNDEVIKEFSNYL